MKMRIKKKCELKLFKDDDELRISMRKQDD